MDYISNKHAKRARERSSLPRKSCRLHRSVFSAADTNSRRGDRVAPGPLGNQSRQGTSLRLATRPWFIYTGEYGGSGPPGKPALIRFANEDCKARGPGRCRFPPPKRRGPPPLWGPQGQPCRRVLESSAEKPNRSGEIPLWSLRLLPLRPGEMEDLHRAPL